MRLMIKATNSIHWCYFAVYKSGQESKWKIKPLTNLLSHLNVSGMVMVLQHQRQFLLTRSFGCWRRSCGTKPADLHTQ